MTNDSRLVAPGRSRGSRSRPPPGSSARSRRGALRDVTILVVEDDEPSVRLLKAVLEDERAIVRFARSAEEALEMVDAEKPEVALIDLILPQMSGLLLADRLKADPATADIVLIATTAFNGGSTERIVLAAGFVAYVRKPIDPSTFCGIVERAARRGKP